MEIGRIHLRRWWWTWYPIPTDLIVKNAKKTVNLNTEIIIFLKKKTPLDSYYKRNLYILYTPQWSFVSCTSVHAKNVIRCHGRGFFIEKSRFNVFVCMKKNFEQYESLNNMNQCVRCIMEIEWIIAKKLIKLWKYKQGFEMIPSLPGENCKLNGWLDQNYVLCTWLANSYTWFSKCN